MRKVRGFTLVELMIVIAIIGILAGIGLPAYQGYVLRGKLAEASSQLGGLQLRMEQYYQDNRNYGPAACGIPAPASPTVKYFDYACVLTNAGQGFTYTATGKNETLGINFTINEAGAKTTVWNGTTSNCWLDRQGGSC